MWGLFLPKPNVGIPSGRLIGQIYANKVDIDNANDAATNNIGAGLDSQNHFSPALAENRVRKSDTATFKKIDVVI